MLEKERKIMKPCTTNIEKLNACQQQVVERKRESLKRERIKKKKQKPSQRQVNEAVHIKKLKQTRENGEQ